MNTLCPLCNQARPRLIDSYYDISYLCIPCHLNYRYDENNVLVYYDYGEDQFSINYDGKRTMFYFFNTDPYQTFEKKGFIDILTAIERARKFVVLI
jgi:hypothetical protein